MVFSSDTTLAEVEEITEVFYSTEKIVNTTVETFSKLRKSLDICGDSRCPSMFVVPNDPVSNVYRELRNRNMRLRFITEINFDNVGYCKELMEICDLRHLDEVKGNFGLADGIHYTASAKIVESSPPPLLIHSTLKVLVEQQEYFFEMLWKKAIPARQRIKEIEENLKREFIETINDSEETTSLILKVLSSATEEILIIFSRANALKKYEKLDILDVVRNKADKGAEVRLLIGTDKPVNARDVDWLKEYPLVEFRYLNKSIQTSLTTIVTDRELSLVIEEKEGNENIDLGLATYSNSDSTVLSCASIFENLWAQSNSQKPQTRM